MTELDPRNSRILIYVDCSEDIEYERIPIELFSSLDVILLGIYPVSDQATPEQTRDNFGGKAEETVQLAVDHFSLSDVDPETMVKFTSEPVETMNDVASDSDCDAILTPGEFDGLERILIPVKGTEDAGAMTTFICDLLEGSPKNVTLVGFVTDEAEEPDHHSHLEQFEDDLVSGGLEDGKIEIRTKIVDDVEHALIKEIDQYDLAILGESEPELRDVVVGNVHENVLDSTVVPLITIRFHGGGGHQQQMRDRAE